MDEVRRLVLQRKIDFYAELDAWENDDDDVPDPGRTASEEAVRRVKERKQKPRNHPFLDITAHSRGLAATNPVADQPHYTARTDVLSAATLSLQCRDHQLQKTLSTTNDLPQVSPSIDTICDLPRKRKREAEIKVVAEEQQVFKGLYLYFFPNSDACPARRMRIRKAIEFGAIWEKQWSHRVTHVIMDKSLEFEALLQYLKLQTFPQHVIVVRESYPAVCIAYRVLIDPREPLYAVKRPVENHQLKPYEEETLPSSRGLREMDVNVTSAPADLRSPDARRTATLNIDQDHDQFQCKEVQSTVEVDDTIEQSRALRYVALDIDESDKPYKAVRFENFDLANKAPKSRLKLIRQRKTKLQEWVDKFQCMQKHTGDKSNSANQATIDILQQMAAYYGQTGDEWRTRGYRKAISALRNHPTRICTKEEALALPNVGERLASKIEEIVFTNRLRRLDNTLAEPRDQILQTFMQIYGVGFAQASKWVNQGYTTLHGLLQSAQLTTNQRLGIDHYEDFRQRIPRIEVEQHGAVVRTALKEIDAAFEVIIGGSYRRGAATSGDIDCVLTHPEAGLPQIRAIVVDQLIPQLFAQGFLVATLAALRRAEGTKWHGASHISTSAPTRRIDLLLVPSQELGAAMLYFTGNDIFNRSLRLLASRKGYSLNQHGLYEKMVGGQARQKISTGRFIEGRDERRILDILGVPWRPPEHRNC